MMKKIVIFALCIVLTCSVVACGADADKGQENIQQEIVQPEEISSDFSVNLDIAEKVDIPARVSVHDPSIIKDGGYYYIFGSHMVGAKTSDLRHWEGLGNGYSINNAIFDKLIDDEDAFAYSGNKDSLIPTDDGKVHVWAPDVIYNKNVGKYFMYFCTSSTWNASNLCYAVADNVEGPYKWMGALIYSGFDRKQISDTNVLDYVSEEHAMQNYFSLTKDYNYALYPNAIDPTVFYDKDDRMWMTYGSWSGGIFLLELDPQTGLVIHPEANPEKNTDPYFGKRLIGGGHNSIEGPYIIYDADSDYYYLMVSYGGLLKKGGYQIRVFRSKDVDGEYTDMNGKAPFFGDKHEEYGLKLSGNYILPSLTQAYMATGHNSALIDDDGKKYIVYHTRFEKKAENHEPRVSQYGLNEEGWPCMLPYATSGETIIKGPYDSQNVVGEYYAINQGTKIDDNIAKPVKLILTDRGNIYCKESEQLLIDTASIDKTELVSNMPENFVGKWNLTDGTGYIHMLLGDTEYSGILCEMKDQSDNKVMTISVVGDNMSIWGVKY